MTIDRDGARPDIPAVLRTYRYRPRTIEVLGQRSLGRWRVKGTAITVRGSARHFGEEMEAAWAQAGTLLAALPETGRDAGVAFLIAHVGFGGVRLLLDWWHEADGLMSRRLFAPLDDPTAFADGTGQPLGPTVWDLAVQAHERAAWLRHVLANPAGPDLDAYFADGMNAVV